MEAEREEMGEGGGRQAVGPSRRGLIAVGFPDAERRLGLRAGKRRIMVRTIMNEKGMTA